MNEILIRASSLPTMFDCAARWYAQNVEGLRTPNGGAAHLGTSLHHASAQFDLARVEEKPITTDDAVDLFVDRCKNPNEEDGEVVWDRAMPKQKAVDVGVRLTLNYCENHAPRYLFCAVEVRCEPLTIDMGDGVRITLTGQADRVRYVQPIDEPWWKHGDTDDGAQINKYGICDVKSGRRIVAADGSIAIDKHVAQLGQYELIQLLAHQKLGYKFTLPAEVIAFPTSGSRAEVSVATVESPSRLLLGDEAQPQGLLHMAAKMAKAELFPGNPKSVLCSEKYCPKYHTCWWRGVK
jgi:hypothetical protein